MLKTTQVTKTAPVFAFSLPCNSVLVKRRLYLPSLYRATVLWLDANVRHSNTDKVNPLYSETMNSLHLIQTCRNRRNKAFKDTKARNRPFPCLR